MWDCNTIQHSASRPGVRDLPRFDPGASTPPKRALIGDTRNDENVNVSQFHAAILQFHNKLVDTHPTASFEDVQRLVQWHYEWLVINDFLPAISGGRTFESCWAHQPSQSVTESTFSGL
jgi:hypothetical protein